MTKDSFIQAVQLIWIQGGSLTDKRIRTINLLNQYEAETEQLHKPDVGRSAIHCFECPEHKDLIKDPHHRDTWWCKTHYPQRH